MNAATARATLDAGGVVPVGVRIKTEIPLDPLVARQWSHPALPDPVVRVDLDALSLARDLEMEVLGFGEGADEGPIAKSPRRAFGFPAAAILGDPDNARYALEVVKQFKKAARRAKSKPGFAKADFDAIAEKLGRSVPHYLPSFYEEACRVLLDCGNRTFAGQLFEKARVAERVHALEVDENLRENTFVEFALAGALSIKSLTNYAKELSTSGEPLPAYQTFRRVCVKRTMGGLPPFGAMNKELKRLAKGAELDVAAEEHELLTELLEAPSLAQAGTSFFKPYAKTLKAMCLNDPSVRDRLLALWPAASDGNGWLDFLESIEALPHLSTWEPRARKAWLERLVGFKIGWRAHRRGKWLRLYEEGLEAIKAAGGSFSFEHNRTMDLDLVEMLLANGIDVEIPERWCRLTSLDDWAGRVDEPYRGCDPVHIAAHEGLLPKLLSELDDDLGHSVFTPLALEREGFRTAIDLWLGKQLATLQSGGALPDLYASLDNLESHTNAQIWGAFPAHLETLKSSEVAPALAETLRIGIFDELGWTALDEAAAEFPETAELVLSGFFPHATLGWGRKAIVLGPRARIAELDLQIPADARVTGFRWVQGKLLTVYRPADTWRSVGVWSHDWTEVFECDLHDHACLSALMDDGSHLVGGGRFSAGDRSVPRGDVICDGAHYWTLGDSWPRRYVELDEKGRRGRGSRPDFFESYVVDGTSIAVGACWLTVMPAEVTRSPFGQRGNLSGLRRRTRSESALVDIPAFALERIDGASIDSNESDGEEAPTFLLDFPGHEQPIVLAEKWRGMALQRRDGVRGSVFHKHYRRGARATPTFLHWWHFAEPRDLAGSIALRDVTIERARALVAAGVEAYGAAESKDDEKVFTFAGTPLESRVTAIFPEVTHPTVLKGIGGIAFMAGKDQRRLTSLQGLVDSMIAADVSREPDPPGLREAMDGLADFQDEASTLDELRTLHELFEGLEQDGEKTFGGSCGSEWWDIVDKRGAIAYRAMLAETSDEHRHALVELLRAFAASPVTVDSSKLRRFSLEECPVKLADGHRRFMYRRGANLYYGERIYRERFDIVEWSPSGTFTALGATNPLATSWGAPDEVEAFAAAVCEPIDPAELGESVAEASGLTLTEARVLLYGLPDTAHPVQARFKLKANPYSYAARFCRGDESRRTLLHAAFAADSSAPFTAPAVFAANVARAWVELKGEKLPGMSEALAERVAAELKEDDPFGAMRSVLSKRSEIYTDAVWSTDSDGDVNASGGFDQNTPLEALRILSWLALYAPVGDPARSAIPLALAALRERLALPDLRFPLDTVYREDRQDKLIALIGGVPFEGVKGPVDKTAQGDGFFLQPNRWSRTLYAHPRVIEDKPEELTAILGMVDWWGGWVDEIRLLQGGFGGWVARISETPVPEGQYECNPLHSAPEVVKAVCAREGVTENAAVLYLQLLVLPAPKDRSVRDWNGWSAAKLKAAGKELLDASLVLQAKRARAGRTLFLPGGWEELKTPFLPVETWKLPFYICTRDDEGKIRSAMNYLVPLQPIHEVFATAWDRVQSGDAPCYEEPGR